MQESFFVLEAPVRCLSTYGHDMVVDRVGLFFGVIRSCAWSEIPVAAAAATPAIPLSRPFTAL